MKNFKDLKCLIFFWEAKELLGNWISQKLQWRAFQFPVHNNQPDIQKMKEQQFQTYIES